MQDPNDMKVTHIMSSTVPTSDHIVTLRAIIHPCLDSLYCPYITITNVSVHFQKCPGLNNKLHDHPLLPSGIKKQVNKQKQKKTSYQARDSACEENSRMESTKKRLPSSRLSRQPYNPTRSIHLQKGASIFSVGNSSWNCQLEVFPWHLPSFPAQ